MNPIEARPRSASAAVSLFAVPIAILGVSLALLATHVDPLAAQTPEQRYADWATPVFPLDEYEHRRTLMLEQLAQEGGGMFLIPSGDGSPRGGTFRQLDDFQYFTGLELPGSMLVLDGDNGRSMLFLPARDARFENPGRRNDFPGRPLGDDPQVIEWAGVDEALDVTGLPGAIQAWVADGRVLLVNTGRPGTIAGPELDYFGFIDPIPLLVMKLRSDHPQAALGNAFTAIAKVRQTKQPVEIAMMRAAADATSEAIRAAAALIRPGIDERTLQGAFEAACRAHGAQAIPFTPIIKTGQNSLWPWRVLAAHYDRRNGVLQDGDLVILDVGCEVNGYVSDVGRTFPVNGTFTQGQADILAISTRAADAIIAAARPGITLAELTAIAYESIPDSQERYMQTGSYFGHHIGMSTGDPVLTDDPLEPGMVLTVEPWYYNHDRDIAVFVEDVIVITEDGAEVLTRALPRDARGLEGLMNR
jgi:Xaa-Pro aminopeptidase